MVAEGTTDQQILADYPDLEEEDIREALIAVSGRSEKLRRRLKFATSVVAAQHRSL
jgi:uncharacterized protein (DUF433 family)